jgi:hypothetical protein
MMAEAALKSDCIAFCDGKRLAAGAPPEVALAVKAALEIDHARQILVFDAHTSRPIDFDLRGDAATIRARLAATGVTSDLCVDQPGPAEPQPAKAGRPKLGVVAREVTLLPRHWDWLAGQPGGASVTLRKLVEAARRQQAGSDDRRAAQEAAYRFMSAMLGNEIGFEEATRALFANDPGRFARLTESWPADLKQHLGDLAARAFPPDQSTELVAG